MDLTLTASQKQYLLRSARESIRSRLDGTPPVLGPAPKGLDGAYGAFVTLHTDGRLRGCIGTLSSTKRLPDVLLDLARSAAFSDPRFTPLTVEELPRTEIELSVLSPLKGVADIESIMVGEHGVYIVSGARTGVLLPQVAVEHGWDRITFLEHACIKAGLPADAWRCADVAIHRFSAVVFSETKP